MNQANGNHNGKVATVNHTGNAVDVTKDGLSLSGRKIAVLVANGFEENHMIALQKPLIKAGATVKLISPENGVVNSWHGSNWGHYFPVDANLSQVLSSDYDMVIITGGARALLKLNQSAHTGRILRGFMDTEKPVVAFGHAVELLAAAGRVQGRSLIAPTESVEKVTSAGGSVVTDAVSHEDGNLYTSIGASADMAVLVDEILAKFAAYVPMPEEEDADVAA